MLREYRLTNFKAFGETVTIPIRPLTLIFGANSSGKSSIFQSLLLLKQTLEEAKNPATVLLPKGSLVDLGTYRDFVYRHETGRNFEFGARFDLESTEYSTNLLRVILDPARAACAGLNVRFSHSEEYEALALLPDRIDISIGDETRSIISCLPKRTQYDHNYDNGDAHTVPNRPGKGRIVGKVVIDSESEFWHHWYAAMKKYVERKSREKIHPPEVSSELWDDLLQALESDQPEKAILSLKRQADFLEVFYGNFFPFLFEVVAVTGGFEDTIFSNEEELEFPRYSKGFLSSGQMGLERSSYFHGVAQGLDDSALHICSNFRLLLEDLRYLGPIRSHPSRHYTFSGDTTRHVGQSGEYLPSILFQRPELVEQINHDLERLGVKYEVRVDKLQYEDKSPSNVFSLRLVDTETGIDASLRDVGFGIGQVLPVVVQNRLSEKKMLLIEQPEIHLHPAHQAELGDMFIRSAKEGGNTLLLETHSENLVLRILRRIRESSDNELPEGFPPLRPEDVAVLYVQPGKNGAEVIEIPVTEDGDFARPWPQGFFEESVKELF